jgi:hypothetical protein
LQKSLPRKQRRSVAHSTDTQPHHLRVCRFSCRETLRDAVNTGNEEGKWEFG